MNARIDPVEIPVRDPNEESVADLRRLFTPAAARLTPDVEPAFAYAWRKMRDADASSAELNDQE